MFKFLGKEKCPAEYCAQIITIPQLEPIEDSDHLAKVNVLGETVVVRKDEFAKGDVCLFFPRECEINDMFLHLNSMYKDRLANENQEKEGYIERNGRVRTIKLRGILSTGLIVQLPTLYKWIAWVDKQFDALLKNNDVEAKRIVNSIDSYKDYISGIEVNSREYWLTKPYIPAKCENQFEYLQRQSKKRMDKKDFKLKFHYDTEPLERNIESGIVKLNEYESMRVSVKHHGTSFIAGNVKVDSKLCKLLKKMHFNKLTDMLPKKHQVQFASRTQNRTNDKLSLWYRIGKLIEDFIPQGYTVYGELVGYDITRGSLIQKDYDYKCKPNTCKLVIYRITKQTETDTTVECRYEEANAVANLIGSKIDKTKGLTEVYHVECEIIPLLPFDTDIKFLKERYNIEGNESMCYNKVPREGLVIVFDDDTSMAWKVKSKAFLEKEGKMINEIEKQN